jgi:hypothetical protein
MVYLTGNPRTIPCICTRNSVFIRRADSDSLSLRDEQSESISSMNMMLGRLSRARSNRFFTNLRKNNKQQTSVNLFVPPQNAQFSNRKAKAVIRPPTVRARENSFVALFRFADHKRRQMKVGIRKDVPKYTQEAAQLQTRTSTGLK